MVMMDEFFHSGNKRKPFIDIEDIKMLFFVTFYSSSGVNDFYQYLEINPSFYFIISPVACVCMCVYKFILTEHSPFDHNS